MIFSDSKTVQSRNVTDPGHVQQSLDRAQLTGQTVGQDQEVRSWQACWLHGRLEATPTAQKLCSVCDDESSTLRSHEPRTNDHASAVTSTDTHCNCSNRTQLWVTEWVRFNVPLDTTGHFGDGPPGNHLHWYGQQKLTAKSIKPTQTKTKIQ